MRAPRPRLANIWEYGASVQNPEDGFTGRVHYNGLDGKPLADFYLQSGSVQGGTPMVYFAGKRVDNGSVEDRLGTAVVEGATTRMAYFPYGELRSGTSTEVQYATYKRDSTTNLDYAQRRYYSSQIARFTTPDPKRKSAKRDVPQSWNRYRYASGDPVNRTDPTGLCDVITAGVGLSSQDPLSTDINAFATKNGMIIVYPYPNTPALGATSVLLQGNGQINGSSLAAAAGMTLAQLLDPSTLTNLTTWSGGAQANASGIPLLSPGIQSQIGSITYVSPGASGPLPSAYDQPPLVPIGTSTTAVAGNGSPLEIAVSFTGLINLSGYVPVVTTSCGHDFACEVGAAPVIQQNVGSACPADVTISAPPSMDPSDPLEVVSSTITFEEDGGGGYTPEQHPTEEEHPTDYDD